jgi:hypothetical protein
LPSFGILGTPVMDKTPTILSRLLTVVAIPLAVIVAIPLAALLALFFYLATVFALVRTVVQLLLGRFIPAPSRQAKGRSKSGEISSRSGALADG